MSQENRLNISPKKLAKNALAQIPVIGLGPLKALASTIQQFSRTNEAIICVSTVCPAYETDAQGRPTYQGLEEGIIYNIEQHLTHVPKMVNTLREGGLSVTHSFLMADTEVDLLDFLQERLRIEPAEFTRRCQSTVDEITHRLRLIYGAEVDYKEIPPAARFLEFFGSADWYRQYEYFLQRLLAERQQAGNGRVAQALENDYDLRISIVRSLRGRIGDEEGIAHIARQKAQYMAFAKLMRERFEGRLVIINHQTPNFAWMNDEITRERENPEDTTKHGPLPNLPLVELRISTMPGNI